ncbi:hypothetical protein K431DRAFT_284857 [Polychaeton citri CBS 116435]|uniref:Uncharacterized protein n=1 Tax=Polychaeton citri CBS 116435 TaxID=1314669 RepID=A0A9P4UMP5_9PEZI|nr:hypothetical protein K431DRAFT_284857 [Polychaeton citri CBS 116435]
MSGAGSRRTNFGVYEEDMDNTDRFWDMGQAEKTMHSQGRWKYDGPWVASMTEGEFKLYMDKQVSKRRGEWRRYLGEKLAQLHYAEARQSALNDGEIEPFISSKTLEHFRPDEQGISKFEQDLRKEHADDNLTSALTKLLVEFLDLPALQSDKKISSKDDKNNIMAVVTQQLGIGDINTGPPSTHPGAGLSHLRTSAVLENHPLHGPQAHKSPILSRVLAPRSSSHGNIQQARLGVGGFVALDPQTARFAPDKYKSSAATPTGPAQEFDPEEMSKHFDFDRKGGNKMWVHPEYASIDEDSRIRLAVSRAEQEAVAVKTGDVQYLHDAKAAADQIGPGGFGGSASRFAPGGRQARPANYGYSLPDMRKMLDQQVADGQDRNAAPAGMRRRPQVEGLDAELAKPGAGGNEAAQRIKELMERQQ